jgi:hypothetical protein
MNAKGGKGILKLLKFDGQCRTAYRDDRLGFSDQEA